MSFLDDVDTDTPIETRGGRRYPYGTIGEWVPLAPVSHLAVRLYTIFRLHVNRERGDDLVWPKQPDLAAMCGVSRRQTISTAVTELVNLRAVDAELERYARGLRQRIIYTVHEAPPEDYDGPVSLRQWYAAHKIVQDLAEPRLVGAGK